MNSAPLPKQLDGEWKPINIENVYPQMDQPRMTILQSVLSGAPSILQSGLSQESSPPKTEPLSMSTEPFPNQTIQPSTLRLSSQKILTKNEFLTCHSFFRELRITTQERNALACFFPTMHASQERLNHIIQNENSQPYSIVKKNISVIRSKLRKFDIVFKTDWGRGYYFTPEQFAKLNNLLITSFPPIDDVSSLGYNSYFIVMKGATQTPVKNEDGVPRMWSSEEEAYDWLEKQGRRTEDFPIKEVNLNFV